MDMIERHHFFHTPPHFGRLQMCRFADCLYTANTGCSRWLSVTFLAMRAPVVVREATGPNAISSLNLCHGCEPNVGSRRIRVRPNAPPILRSRRNVLSPEATRAKHDRHCTDTQSVQRQGGGSSKISCRRIKRMSRSGIGHRKGRARRYIDGKAVDVALVDAPFDGQFPLRDIR